MMNSFLKLLKIQFYWKVVRRILLGDRPTIHVGEAMNCFGELPNKFTSEDCPTYLYRRVAHNLNKYFCLKMVFIHGIRCVRESVRTRDMGLVM